MAGTVDWVEPGVAHAFGVADVVDDACRVELVEDRRIVNLGEHLGSSTDGLDVLPPVRELLGEELVSDNGC